jgi:hypothetical protein
VDLEHVDLERQEIANRVRVLSPVEPVEDVRPGGACAAARSSVAASVDVFNLLNSNAIVNANQNFGAWLRPTQILSARVVKFSVQFDY